MKDKYDEAIEYLTEHPTEIWPAWQDPRIHQAGILFLHCGDSSKKYDHGDHCGCLTQIRSDHTYFVAATDDLTEAIRKDDRIPRSPSEITVEHLATFAEWQRKIDALGVR
jgi:hypothetical protein